MVIKKPKIFCVDDAIKLQFIILGGSKHEGRGYNKNSQ